MIHQQPTLGQKPFYINKAEDGDLFLHPPLHNNIFAIIVELFQAGVSLVHAFSPNQLVALKIII